MLSLYKVSNPLYSSTQSNFKPITVVLLHGNSQSSVVWKNQLSSDLFGSMHLVAMDLPGHGNSPEHHSYSISDLLIILKQNIEGYERIILVGHSLGGHLAMELLPSLTNCIGLFVIGAPPLKRPVNVVEAFKPDSRMGLLFQKDLGPDDIRSLTEMLGVDKLDISIDFTKVIEQTRPEFREALGEALSSGELANESDILKTATIPIALVVGADDELVNVEYVKQLPIPFLWKGQVQIIEKSGHVPQLDATSVFNALLLDFINSVVNE
ncbi:alpha/beta hydrolase [uncultured Zobellia sp.]|uniref:alpha/beta fold hydrolase n=1 Tax=uncultured Zobellia sp. TaxID=255433 RepID=UPI00259811BE|nr:alpha/beta hydrolase [uncultured Zobellia sp.]